MFELTHSATLNVRRIQIFSKLNLSLNWCFPPSSMSAIFKLKLTPQISNMATSALTLN